MRNDAALYKNTVEISRMVEKNTLSAICDFLLKKRDSDPRLAPRLSDRAIQSYVHFCQNVDVNVNTIACPICLLTKGRVQYLLPPRPFQTTFHGSHLICEFCYEHIPVGPNT